MGELQAWDPTLYARHAALVPRLGARVVELLAPLAGERILDLGCGDGALTRQLVDAGREVVGVDASAEQVSAARALRPGGRSVAELGGRSNIATLVGGLEAGLRRRGIDPTPHNPFTFPAADEYEALLARHRFQVRFLALFPRPTRPTTDVVGWLQTFAAAFAAPVVAQAGGASAGEAARAALYAEIDEDPRVRMLGPDGTWEADYVRLRFHAVLG